MHADKHTHTHMHVTHTCTNTRTRTRTRTRTHTHTHTHTHTYACNTHTRSHTCMQTNTHTHTDLYTLIHQLAAYILAPIKYIQYLYFCMSVGNNKVRSHPSLVGYNCHCQYLTQILGSLWLHFIWLFYFTFHITTVLYMSKVIVSLGLF